MNKCKQLFDNHFFQAHSRTWLLDEMQPFIAMKLQILLRMLKYEPYCSPPLSGAIP